MSKPFKQDLLICLMHIESKCVLLARRKVKDQDDFPYVVDLKFFGVNDPHKSAALPDKTMWYKVEYVRIEVPVNYYLMGSDIIINDAGKLNFVQEGRVLFIRRD